MFQYILNILCILSLTHSLPSKRPHKLSSFASNEDLQQMKPIYIEDTFLNFTELTTKYGYPSEHHTVTTEDGYLLTVFRILPKCQVTQGPVILGHGIVDSSDTWIVTGPKTGLGYFLSNNCYDAWAINFRGNVYSRKHLFLDPDKDKSFWDFSFDEMGLYDLPAVIDYVLNVTNRQKAYYIGHSQGSTNFFVMGSLKPDYNEKIQLSVLLAPVAWLKNVKSPLPKLITRRYKEIRTVIEDAGFNELFAKHQLTHSIAKMLCQLAPNGVCGTVLAFTTGYELGSITSLNLAVAFGHVLVGVSVKTLAHFAQLIDSGQFRRYDEGKAENIKKYGASKPPKYDVSLITSPILAVSAKRDWVSTSEDIDILVSKLPNLVENYVVPEPTWSHNDIVWADNATELVFKKIINYFQKFDLNT